MRDLELLRIETALLWNLDAQGRIRAPVDLAVGIASDGVIAAVGRHGPDEVAAKVLDRARGNTPPRQGEPPDWLREMQTPDLVLSGGPSYYIEPPISFASAARIIRSDSPQRGELANMRPDNWAPGEWIELINGRSGAPWAMVLDAGRIVSICHTPGRTSAAAEAGTWTDPEFRGLGYAAATTVAWAEVLAPDCAHLFYSTSADNYSSRHVAERLGLRPIGWTWKLARV